MFETERGRPGLAATESTPADQHPLKGRLRILHPEATVSGPSVCRAPSCAGAGGYHAAVAEREFNRADDGTPSRWGPARLAVLLLTVFVVAAAAALAIPFLRATADPAPVAATTVAAPTPTAAQSAPPGDGFLCVESATEPHCDRYVADLTRRAPLDEAGQRTARAASERMDGVMPPGREGPCEFDEELEICSVEILPPLPGQVRQALDKAGYRTAVIRTARIGDPAPVGSLLIAVPVGRGCVLSFDDGDGAQSWTAGQLPDGSCLNS